MMQPGADKQLLHALRVLSLLHPFGGEKARETRTFGE